MELDSGAFVNIYFVSILHNIGKYFLLFYRLSLHSVVSFAV